MQRAFVVCSAAVFLFLISSLQGSGIRQNSEHRAGLNSWRIQLRGTAGKTSLPPNAVFRLGSTRLWHSAWVRKIAVSPNGKRIASADYWGYVRVWDIATGRKLHEFPKYTGRAVAFSPDGKILATGAKKIHLYNAKTGELIRTLPYQLPPSGGVMDLTLSPDGKLLASVAGRQGLAAGEAQIHIWNVATGESQQKLQGPNDGAYSVAFSPDGKTLATGGGAPGYRPNHSKLQLWDLAKGTVIWEKQGHPTGVYSVSFSADGKFLASSDAYEARVWNSKTGKLLHKISGASYGIAFSPQGTHLATARPLRLYNAATGKVVAQMNQNAYTVTFTPDGRFVVSGNQEGMVKLWHVPTGNEIVKRRGHGGEISTVAFSPCGRLIASASAKDQTLRIWGAATGAALRTLPLNSTVQPQWRTGKGQRIFFSPKSRKVAIWTGDGVGHFWDLASGGQFKIQTGATRGIGNVMFPDWRNFGVFHRDDGTRQMAISFWDVADKKHQRSVFPFGKQRSPDSRFGAMMLSPDGNVLALSGRISDRRNRNAPTDAITLIDVDTGNTVRTFAPTYYVPDYVAFSPDGKRLASSGSGDHVFLWDVATGKELGRFASRVRNANNTSRSAPIAFSPNGKILAAVRTKSQIVLYDVDSSKVLKTFNGHEKYVTCLAFSPDGTRLVSGGGDSTVYVWQVTAEAPKKAATPKQLLQWWAALGEQDAVLARSALEQMVAAGEQTVNFLSERLKPAEYRDADRIPQLIEDLASAKQKVRSRAEQALQEFGEAATPELFKVLLARKTPLPTRKRVEQLLETIDEYPISPKMLQHLRAVEVLEHIGSKSALMLLAKVAGGAPTAQITREAVAATKRLGKRQAIALFRVLTDQEIKQRNFGGKIESAAQALERFRAQVISILKKAPEQAQEYWRSELGQPKKWSVKRQPFSSAFKRVDDTLTPNERKTLILHGKIADLKQAGDCWAVEHTGGFGNSLTGYLDVRTGRLIFVWVVPEG